VELHGSHVAHVATEDADGRVLLHVPDTGGAVVAATDEVVAQRTELAGPHWELMAVVDHQTGAGLQRPAADCGVDRAGDQVLVVYRDAQAEDRARVSYKGALRCFSDGFGFFAFRSGVEDSLSDLLQHGVLPSFMQTGAFATQQICIQLDLQTIRVQNAARVPLRPHAKRLLHFGLVEPKDLGGGVSLAHR